MNKEEVFNNIWKEYFSYDADILEFIKTFELKESKKH